tara:strand:- start:2625 stop:3092 length:468 start_codon:yes stop_codon:yes gene_type:complete
MATYTKPALRNRIKNRIMAGKKGGKAGEWSARKAQMLASAYKKAGGGYKGGKTAKQKSLKKWTGEKWRTSDKKPAIRKDSSGKTVTKRYLPDKAWKKLSASQKAATNKKKVAGSKKGKQVVKNTKAAAKASKSVRKKATTAKKRVVKRKTTRRKK